jgi:hypothetical protein
MISITGIIINAIMVIIIIVLLVFGFMFNRELHACETKQSPFCYTIQCPCDSTTTGRPPPPCFGYAKMQAERPGQWYCSNAPLTAVDDNGNIV